MFLYKIRRCIGNMLNELSKVSATTLPNRKLAAVEKTLVFAGIDSNDTLMSFNWLRKELQRLCPSTKVKAILFIDSEKRAEIDGISDYEKEFLTDEDFSFFFKIKNDAACKLLADQYDIAVNMCCEEHVYIDYLYQFARANIRVGLQNGVNKNLNFIINSSSLSTDQLCRHITQNLQMFFK